VKKESLATCSYPLMKLLLFEDSHRFFSLTDTEDEISLIMSEAPMKVFKSVVDWELCQNTWIGIQVCEGSLGFTSVGVVHALSDPLAKAGISIFNLSTSDTDYALVPEDRIYDAIDCLEEEFTLLTEGLEELAKIVPRPEKKTNERNDERVCKQHPLSLPRSEIYICSFRKDEASAIATSLLKIIFFPKSAESRFFSYTESEDEISLLLDKNSVDLFPDVPNPSGPWKLIKVDDGPLGFSETGIVCSLAETLSDVSLFYVSTFFTDYVLVEASSIEKAISVLKRENFEVRQ